MDKNFITAIQDVCAEQIGKMYVDPNITKKEFDKFVPHIQEIMRNIDTLIVKELSKQKHITAKK